MDSAITMRKSLLRVPRLQVFWCLFLVDFLTTTVAAVVNPNNQQTKLSGPYRGVSMGGGGLWEWRVGDWGCVGVWGGGGGGERYKSGVRWGWALWSTCSLQLTLINDRVSHSPQPPGGGGRCVCVWGGGGGSWTFWNHQNIIHEYRDS